MDPSARSLLDGLWQTWLDLLTLETNTIIKKQGMTARKMRAVPLALLDVARGYSDFIQQEAGYDLAGWWSADGQAPDTRRRRGPARLGDRPPGRVQRTTGSATFQRLEWAARHILSDYESELSDDPERPRRGLVLYRIARNAAELGRLVSSLEAGARAPGGSDWSPYADRGEEDVEEARTARHPLPQLNPREATLLRKIWDVGTEHVVLQTIIQLDGDVVTRIEPGLVRSNDCELILAIHGESVRHSVQYWQFLVQTLQQFFQSIGPDADTAGR